MRTDLTHQLTELLMPRKEILFAFLHGSFLDSESLAHDIDVAVYVDLEKMGGLELFDYRMQLSVDLSRQTGREIDVQTLTGAPVGFRHSVFKHGKLLFCKDEELMSEVYEETTLEYIDFYELSREYTRDLIP